MKAYKKFMRVTLMVTLALFVGAMSFVPQSVSAQNNIAVGDFGSVCHHYLEPDIIADTLSNAIRLFEIQVNRNPLSPANLKTYATVLKKADDLLVALEDVSDLAAYSKCMSVVEDFGSLFMQAYDYPYSRNVYPGYPTSRVKPWNDNDAVIQYFTDGTLGEGAIIMSVIKKPELLVDETHYVGGSFWEVHQHGLGRYNSFAGYPESHMYKLESGSRIMWQNFYGGQWGDSLIVGNPQGNAYIVSGWMLNRYEQEGIMYGVLGIPTSNIYYQNGYAYQEFEHGTICHKEGSSNTQICSSAFNGYTLTRPVSNGQLLTLELKPDADGSENLNVIVRKRNEQRFSGSGTFWIVMSQNGLDTWTQKFTYNATSHNIQELVVRFSSPDTETMTYHGNNHGKTFAEMFERGTEIHVWAYLDSVNSQGYNRDQHHTRGGFKDRYHSFYYTNSDHYDARLTIN